MNFKINKKIFDDTLEIVSKYTDPISTFFSFRCIYITVDNEYITLKAANDATSIVKKIVVDDVNVLVEEPGEFLVQANVFKSIVKKLSGMINITKTATNLLDISQGNSKYQITTLTEKHFPAIDNLLNTKQLSLNTAEFKKAIKSVSHASSLDNSLIYKCINMKKKNDVINFTATDSYRLAIYQYKCDEQVGFDFDFSINSKDLKDLIPSDAPEKVTFFFNDIKVGVKYENTVIISRIVSIPFVDTESIFKNMDVAYTIAISKTELNNMLNKIWMSNGDKQNRIELYINDKEFKIVNNVIEIGNFADKTSNFKFQGKHLEMALNYNFIKDAISVFDDDISILIDQNVKKVLLISSSNKACKQLISPLRR
ncbi:DNA polymerase III subunit beta [Mycoplasmopsis mucosicanis]|uniref:DNA polymerase III subunit beta n=1 Tax=Mycoplasmopsis mucosicanis TaxID=458208 RepID=A0A507SQB2_9BACT|nr:DNA polymerase III subunit beta [Mycoplasmopsis mucosicanis]TQC51562.1 DNA polymerase III subunit beta [Mycoplasmopsis mucosicanis]